MNNDELKKLVEDLVSLSTELESVEFKVNNSNPETIGKYISALSNSACLYGDKKAYLVFGVEDGTHNIVGTSFRPKTEKVGNQQLEFWLSQKVQPKFNLIIHEITIDDKEVVIFDIPPAIDQPTTFDDVSYIRVGSATPPLSEYKDKERQIWVNINKKNFEKGIAKEGLTSDKVLELLDYSEYFTLTKQALPTDTIKFLEKMEQHGLVKKVFDNSYDITNLGAILFANDLNEFPTVKRKTVRVIEYEGTSRRQRKKENEGKRGYAVGWENLIQYIQDRLPHNEKISQDFREEVKMYPEVAIREFLANALIHQDLTITGAGPLIEIFSDRIEILNTGEPLIDVDRFIDHPPQSRNEDLASFMRQIKVCEESGSGIDRALFEITLFQLPAPLFEKFENFTRVTLFAHKELKDMTDEDKVRACYQHCVLLHVEKKRMTNSSLRERLNISDSNYARASEIIKMSKNKGFIKDSEKPREYIPIWA